MPRPLPRLAYHALKILDGFLARSETERPAQTMELRLALAYLHLISGKGREPFDTFWQALQRDHSQSIPTQEAYLRVMAVRGARDAIRDALDQGDREAHALAVRRTQIRKEYWTGDLLTEEERARSARTCSWELDR